MKTNKTITIISWILIILPSLMLLMSAFMKLSSADEMVKAFTVMNALHLLPILGTIELVSVILLLIPKTYKIGFLLVTAYLGGALATELLGGQEPIAAALLAVVWIGVFLRDKGMFLPSSKAVSES